MNNEDISIIVPVYNVEKWIDRCLKSIQRQSYKEFEVLLIDDGSTDNSSLICQKFVSEDNRFKYFKKNNGGLSDARNYGKIFFFITRELFTFIKIGNPHFLS